MLFSWLNIRLYITLILVSTLFFSATKKNMFRPVFLSEINFNDNKEIYITKDSVKNYLDMIVDSMGISLNSNYLNLFEKKLQSEHNLSLFEGNKDLDKIKYEYEIFYNMIESLYSS